MSGSMGLLSPFGSPAANANPVLHHCIQARSLHIIYLHVLHQIMHVVTLCMQHPHNIAANRPYIFTVAPGLEQKSIYTLSIDTRGANCRTKFVRRISLAVPKTR